MSEEEAKTETPPTTVETEAKVVGTVEEEEAPKEAPKEEESTATFEPVVSDRFLQAGAHLVENVPQVYLHLFVDRRLTHLVVAVAVAVTVTSVLYSNR
jgi:hypothetical protein